MTIVEKLVEEIKRCPILKEKDIQVNHQLDETGSNILKVIGASELSREIDTMMNTKIRYKYTTKLLIIDTNKTILSDGLDIQAEMEAVQEYLTYESFRPERVIWGDIDIEDEYIIYNTPHLIENTKEKSVYSMDIEIQYTKQYNRRR